MKLLLWLVIMLGAIYPVKAIRIASGKNIVIDRPVYENLYIAGGEITINAPVHGDLVIAGGTVTINDSITNDILAAGGTISFNGYVGNDIRCTGGRLNILKSVAGDLVATGGNITLNKDVVIGNLVAAGGNITVDGNITGIVKTVSGKLFLNGNVMKDIDCRGGDITINGNVQGRSVLAANNKLDIGRAASFNNEVRYWTPSGEIDFKGTLKNGRAVYDPSLRLNKEQWYLLGWTSVLGLLWFIGTVLVMIMLIQYLFSSTMKKAGETAYDKALRSLGYGLLFWIGVPVVAVVACITVIGVPIGIILLAGYVFLALIAGTITAVVAANWLNSRSDTNWSYWRMVLLSLGIFIVFKILSLTPFLGMFIFGLLVCIAFGSILLNVKWRKGQRTTG